MDPIHQLKRQYSQKYNLPLHSPVLRALNLKDLVDDAMQDAIEGFLESPKGEGVKLEDLTYEQVFPEEDPLNVHTIVKEVQQQYPNLSFKQALQKAREILQERKNDVPK